MKAIRKTIQTGRQIGRDDKGQMLVEMAITLPLVLFMFFAVVQYLFLVNISLAGHYAAFISSRSYAVHNSADHDDAIFYSKMAASMAYTPLSSPAPGESLYYATQTVFDPLTEIESEINSGLSAIGVSVDLLGWFMNLLPDSSGMDNVINGIPKPVRAFMFAYLRMDLHKSEGSDGMEIMAPDGKYNLPQVSMRLNYRLPLWLPGFAETWDLAGGDDVNSTFQSVWEQPAMMVQSVCTMGMELWSGEVNDKEANRDEAENSESDDADSEWGDHVNDHQGTDAASAQENADERQEEMDEAEEDLADAQATVDTLTALCNQGFQEACDALPAAIQARDAAQQRVDDIRNEDQQQADDALNHAQPPSH